MPGNEMKSVFKEISPVLLLWKILAESIHLHCYRAGAQGIGKGSCEEIARAPEEWEIDGKALDSTSKESEEDIGRRKSRG